MMEDLFSKKQQEQIKAKGLEVEHVLQQIENFKKGFPFLKMIKPAVIGDGILALDAKNAALYVEKYDKESKGYQIVKFVPASGAASRMFKDLFQFLSKMEQGNSDIEVNISSVKEFFGNLKKFAFYNDLRNILKNQEDEDLDKLIANKQYLSILNNFLNEEGLNYGNLPKGLLKFHGYDGFSRTPVEEHFVEAAEYAVQLNNRSSLHFTVSPEHITLFNKQFEDCEYHLEEKYKINFDVSCSVQKQSTDMIAVDMDNKPFHDGDDLILYRPGGHGALLENLNDLEADIVFIKNIDNVVPDHLKPETIKYKKALGGVLIDVKDRIFSYLHKLHDENKKVTDKLLTEIKTFINEKLGYIIQADFDGMDVDAKKQLLIKVLDRPIRVCGMVKNEGEPGGGPFWVKGSNGSVSLQIAESSQADLKNVEQKKIFDASTHFNPVDLVCYKRDYKGKLYNLLQFRDPETGFITKKSKDGKDLKAQELPGLWNGSMAFWNTIFVEVPLTTFNPVKTVNDLLRMQHQKEVDS